MKSFLKYLVVGVIVYLIILDFTAIGGIIHPQSAKVVTHEVDLDGCYRAKGDEVFTGIAGTFEIGLNWSEEDKASAVKVEVNSWFTSHTYIMKKEEVSSFLEYIELRRG